MSEILSQEEIDALLKGSQPANTQDTLSVDEMEALSEIMNVSMNTVSTLLISKVKQNVTIQVKDLSDIGEAENAALLEMPLCSFEAELTTGMKAKTWYLFKINDVAVLNDLLMGGDGANKETDELDDLQKNILVELMNELIPSGYETVSEMVKTKIAVKKPDIHSISQQKDVLEKILTNNKLAQITFSFEIGNVLEGEIIQLISIGMAKRLVELLLATLQEEEAPPPAKRMGGKQPMKQNGKGPQVSIQSVSFPSFDDQDDVPNHDESIDFILDVPLQVSVELGKTKKMIKEILAFNVGSIVELNNLAEDYVDILVNGKLVARGEVIVVDENFGVRIMEVYTNMRNNILKS
ncbi:MAG: flagellar motor switch protein FliN [Hyphomonadaceae bacterium]|nr:flagellar motor switch protein FliN [Clostridia bacterium]